MRKILLFSAIIFIAGMVFGAPGQQINLKKSNITRLELLQNSVSGFVFQTSFQNLDAALVSNTHGNFVQITARGFGKSYQIGNPDLPVRGNLIEVPIGAGVEINIVSYDVEIIKLNELGLSQKLMPAQPSLSKSDDPENAGFVVNSDVYSNNGFYQNQMAWYEESGIMRGVRVGNVFVSPFRYNPVENILEVYNNMVVEVKFTNADQKATSDAKARYYSPFYSQMYKGMLNYQGETKAINQHFPVKYVIVSHRMFETTLQPFIAWKQKKGFQVIVKYTDEIGTTTAAIKTYLQGLYTSATETNPAPSFVLLVGDVAQVPVYNGVSDSHVTDLYYFCYDGASDRVPDVTYGRFSASTVAHLQSQIDKTLEYEMYTMPDASYLDEVVMVSGVDAGHAPTYGNGQINYGTTYYFNTAHDITSHTYLYPASGSSASQIIANISAGVGYGNYTAHCSPSGWADPSFETSNIPGLQNAHKYGLLVGNCCQSVQFDDNECFGEAILRAVNKGAIGYIGGSNSTYWDEDYWWGVGFGPVSANPTYAQTTLGAYDRTFHEFGEAEADWSVTQGQMLIGGNLAVEQSTSSRKLYYWEIYHLMGDPSLMPYMSQAETMEVEYMSQLIIGLNSLTVVAEPGALVALSLNGNLLASAITNESGEAILEFESFTEPCTADVVVTKSNRQPYIGTIGVIPGNAPYVLYNHVNINDAQGNNNQMADFGETVLLDLSLTNVGNVATDNMTVKIRTSDPYVAIIDSTESWGTLNGHDTLEIAGAFSVQVNEMIPDQHKVVFEVVAMDVLQEEWISKFNIILNAPVINLSHFTVNDQQGGNGNNRLDIGEPARISIDAGNIGHAVLNNAVCELSSSLSQIHILNPVCTLNPLTLEGSQAASFVLIVDPATQTGTVVDLVFTINAGEYTTSLTIVKKLGELLEDWESGNFAGFNWNTNYTNTWNIVNQGAYQGNYAAKSAPIGHSQDARFAINLDVLANDTVSFYKKVSCEESSGSTFYDYLDFSIDGVSKAKWAGESDWEKVWFIVEEGAHQLAWKYKKDESFTQGGDYAMVDLIQLPMHSVPVVNDTNFKFTSAPLTFVHSMDAYSYAVSVNNPLSGSQTQIDAVELPEWLTLTDNGNGTAVLSGTPTIEGVDSILVVLAAYNGTSFTTQYFYLNVGWPLSVKPGLENYVSIYPNPANNYFTIDFHGLKTRNLQVMLYAQDGKLMHQVVEADFGIETPEKIKINTNNLPSGFYICKICTENTTINKKVSIRK